MAVCVVLHAACVTSAIGWVSSRQAHADTFRRATWLFVRIAGWIVAFHLAEISVWAFFYVGAGALPDLSAALYFSAVTYTTTGYGDVVLPEGWRLLGAIEAVTGILMCGWSSAFFFAVVNRMYGGRPNGAP